VTRVLERLGHSVVFPREQTCCGQMHYNTGYHREAVPLVRRFVQMFREAECVCVPSASCVAMMREHYELIAKHENDAALLADVRALLPRVFEFSELLTERLKMEDVGAIFAHSVTYHPSCHSLRMLNIREGPLKLLRAVRGLELRDLPEKNSAAALVERLR
jgi:L-lactate dehydrogenase complex protein LldE